MGTEQGKLRRQVAKKWRKIAKRKDAILRAFHILIVRQFQYIHQVAEEMVWKLTWREREFLVCRKR